MKQVLYLRSDYSDIPLQGGSMVHMTGIVNALARKGICVIAALPFPFAHLSFDVSVKFVNLHRPPVFPRSLWRITCFFGGLWYPWQLRNIMKQKAFDHIYYRYAFMDLTAVVLKWFFHLPIIMEYNGSEVWIDQQLRPKGELKFRWLARLVERVNIRYADHIIVVSDVLRDQLLKQGVDERKILVNPNGVDTDEFNPEKYCDDRIRVRKELMIEDKFVVCFVGSFSQWHGVNSMKTIISQLGRRQQSVHFLLVGDGDLKRELKEQLRKDGALPFVTFTGSVSHTDVRKYIAASDTCFLPAQIGPNHEQYFCSPLKLFEYMSMAKPVVASDIEQIQSVVSPSIMPNALCENDKGCGLLVAHDREQAFINAIDWIIASSSSVRAQLGKNARERIQKKYSWECNIKNMMSFIECGSPRESVNSMDN